MKIKKTLPAIFGLLVLFFIILRIDSYHRTESPTPSSDGFIMRLFGETRSVFSNMSILQADVYYHGGASMYAHEHDDSCFFDEDHICHDDHSHDDYHICSDETDQIRTNNFLLNIANATHITEHIHLGRDEVQEIIPWLQYAVILDPHNVQAYLLTAYFLANRFEMVDEAIDLLNKGLEHNPASRELYQDLGGITLHILKDYAKAVDYFEQSWELMQKERNVQPYEIRRLLASKAHAYEGTGDLDKALEIFRGMNELYPDSPVTLFQIERLTEKIDSQ